MLTSVQQKYILPFLLGLSCLSAVYIFFILNQHTNLLKTELQRKGKSVIEKFSNLSKVDILLQDEDRLFELTQETTKNDNDLIISAIYIKQNKSLFSNDSLFTFPDLDITNYTEYDLDDYFLFVQAVKDGEEEELEKGETDEVIGLVGIAISKERLNNIIYDIGLRLGLLGLLAFTFVGYFVNYLSKKLKGLADTAVAEAKQIEAAYGELQHLQLELEATNSSLEQRVKERTVELKSANIEFGTANSELKEFAYIVSHDLKAPLRAIDSLTEWIAEDYEEDLDEEGKNLIQTLKGRVTTMNQLIDGVLQYSRISQVRTTPEETDLNEIIEYVWALEKPAAHFSLNINQPLPTIFANYDKIQELIQKLIQNAIRFNDKEKAIITINWSEDNNFIHINIKDNGIGISEKDFDEIFKIFKTLDKKKYKNQIGLGLTLAKRIVEIYNGEITLHSTVKEGTTFTISLPKKNISQPKHQTQNDVLENLV
ncbi:MAG: ATP-binding protein [Saprospiraceae bacterium]